MDFVFIALTKKLTLNTDAQIKINDLELFNTKDKKSVLELINSAEVFRIYGSSYLDDLIEHPFFFGRFTCTDNHERSLIALNAYQVLYAAFRFLWFSKDNCCTIDNYVTFEDRGMCVHANVNSRYVKADNNNPDTIIDIDDFNCAMEVYKKFHAISSVVFTDKQIIGSKTEDGHYVSMKHNVEYNALNRIQRSFDFLDSARKSQILPQKIAYYVMILECLFSGSDAEIQHKLCERVAFYLESTKNERKNLYDKLKIIYSIRSRYVHGEIMTNKFNTADLLVKFSLEIDDIVRKVLTKVITVDSEIFLQKDVDLDKSLGDLIF